jgi:hypothetical protein
MSKTVITAVAAAVNAYLEQEEHREQVKVVPVRESPLPAASTWRGFGRQEAVRARSQWQARRRYR